MKKAAVVLLAALLVSSGLTLTTQFQTFQQAVNAAPVSLQTEIELPAGTPITIKTAEEINTKTTPNNKDIALIVGAPVVRNDKVVIAANAPGTATVTIKKSGALGQEGQVLVNNFYVQAVDGQRIPLVANIAEVGKDKQTMSLALGIILCFPFLFMKGGEAIIPAGTEKTVYTAAPMRIKVP